MRGWLCRLNGKQAANRYNLIAGGNGQPAPFAQTDCVYAMQNGLEVKGTQHRVRP